MQVLSSKLINFTPERWSCSMRQSQMSRVYNALNGGREEICVIVLICNFFCHEIHIFSGTQTLGVFSSKNRAYLINHAPPTLPYLDFNYAYRSTTIRILSEEKLLFTYGTFEITMAKSYNFYKQQYRYSNCQCCVNRQL